jgi:hypothetical protein
MLTFTQGRNLYGQLTNNSSSTNLGFGDTMINEGIHAMLSKLPWPFLEKVVTASTVASQQTYQLPGDLAILISVAVTVGNYTYLATQVTSADDWLRVNNPTNVTSDPLSNFYIVGKTIRFWPIPASSGNTITYHYVRQNRDINTADFTTGTIVTATNGSAIITGSGTSWTAGMVGSFLRITSGNAANLGDGQWYEIASVNSTTQITLSAVYTGVSIVAGGAMYTIGNCSLIPEKFQIAPVYFAASEYYRKQDDDSRADRFEKKYNDFLDLMISEEGTKSSSVVIDDGVSRTNINPNLARWAV